MILHALECLQTLIQEVGDGFLLRVGFATYENASSTPLVELAMAPRKFECLTRYYLPIQAG